MTKRIIKAKIKYISLCGKGANNFQTIYKGGDLVEFSSPICKKELGQGRLTSLVYAPNNVDLQGDFASEDVVMQMMKSFAQDGDGIDFNHDGKTLDKSDVFILESFRLMEGHPLAKAFNDYQGKPVDATGGWAVTIQMEDTNLGNKLKKAYVDGTLNGVSMGGMAQKQEAELTENTLLKTLSKFFMSKPKENDMTPEELAKAFSDNNKALAEMIAKALTPVAPVEKKVEVKVDVFKSQLEFEGDASNAEEVKAHAEAIRKEQLEASVDWSDLDSVIKYQNVLEKMQKKADKSNSKQARPTELKKADNGIIDSDEPLTKSEAEALVPFGVTLYKEEK